ncbi:MAG: GC-type dockerin domain-anchored protein [Phycisphaerales bacterium]
MRHTIKIGIMGAGVSLGAPAALAGGGLHETDFAIRIVDNKIDIGVVTGPGSTVFPFTIRGGEFGDSGVPDFTNNPGWISPGLGALPANTEIGFDIVAAVREWNGLDFNDISDDTVTVRKFLQNFVAPPTDTVVPGIIFGAADADGVFHHHVQFFLNLDAGPMDQDGVWLLQLQLWSDTPGIERSDVLYLVLAQGLGVDEQGDAITWIEDNLLDDGACNDADLSEPYGALDFSDVLAFLVAFGASDPAADLAPPTGVFDFSDVLAFLGAFGAGCP